MAFSKCHLPRAQDLRIELCPSNQRAPKPDPATLQFGKRFTDHMFEVDWDSNTGWGQPTICPVHSLSIHPAAKTLHYALEGFEGLKAFRCIDGKVRLFRADMNMKRLQQTAVRLCLPSFDDKELLTCLRKLISVDKEWAPSVEFSSLYIRPTIIGTEGALGIDVSNQAKLFIIVSPVGPYFKTGIKPVSLLADPRFVRAWPGGHGSSKLGSNYAPTIAIQKHAEKLNLQQVLWLFGDDHQLTEIGAMNIFVLLINSQGDKELVTPPLNGLILPGIVRNSLLELARAWNDVKISERSITMNEVLTALNEKRLLEVFGSGTACVVCPIRGIHYLGKEYEIPTMDHDKPVNQRLLKELTDIQYGRIKHPWAIDVEDD